MNSLVLVLDMWLGCSSSLVAVGGGWDAWAGQSVLFPLSSNFKSPSTTDALSGCGGVLLAWLVPLLCSYQYMPSSLNILNNSRLGAKPSIVQFAA